MNALFFMHPAIGHYIASFQVADILKTLGYSIAYSIPKDFKWVFQNKDFILYESNTFPFGLDFDLRNGEDRKTIIKNRINNKIYSNRKRELELIVTENKTDIIFIDSFNSTDFIPLYQKLKKEKIKIIFLQTMLTTRFNFFHPYVNSADITTNIFSIFFENLRINLKNHALSKFDYLRFLGKDDKSRVKSMFQNEGIPLEYKPKKNYGFGYIFSNIPELVLNPIELEIIEKIAPEQVYLGYFTPERPNNVEIDLFVKELTNCSKKLIYVSFGTLYSHKQKEIEKLLEFLDNIGHEMKNFTIIVSLGNNLILKNKWIYKNLVGLNFVNQIDLLNYADIFITHGGINSIKESINSKCPMLVIPLEGDQVGNASKVVLLNLGCKLSYSELNKESLINCISKLLETDSKIKQNLNLIADRIKKTYSPEKIIQSLLDRTMYLK